MYGQVAAQQEKPKIKPINRFEYQEEIYQAPESMGAVEVKVTGPAGAAAALAQTDFSNPGSVFNSMSIAAAFLPGIAGIAVPALGALSSLFGGISTAEARHNQIMSGLESINLGLGKISAQMSAGFNTLFDLQIKTAIDLKNFMVHLKGEELEAWEIINFSIEGLQADFLNDLKKINLDTEIELDRIHVEAIEGANLKLSAALGDMANQYQQLAIEKLKLFEPFIDKASIDIEAMWLAYLEKLQKLTELEYIVQEYRALLLKPIAVYLFGQFRPELLSRAQEIPGPAPVTPDVVGAVILPDTPPPLEIDGLITQKENERDEVAVVIVQRFIDYLKLILFG